MKYIKKFERHSQYSTYKNSNEYLTPNVSYCILEDEVHYNKYKDTRVVAKFNVETAGDTIDIMASPTTLSDNDAPVNDVTGYFTALEIDGVRLDNVVYSYTFTTSGEHIVKYVLDDDTELGEFAFFACDYMTSVAVPSTVDTIGDYAFAFCMSLTTASIPDGLSSLGEGTFWGCVSLANVNMPQNITVIPYYAFCETALESVEIPNGVTSIGEGAFFACHSLEYVSLPNTLLTIEGSLAFNTDTGTFEGAFSWCESLTSIAIPASVTSIGRGAFANCPNLASITVDPNNAYYDSRNDCNAIIGTNSGDDTLVVGCQNTVIPNGVVSIGIASFLGCATLESIVIPDSVTFIDQYAFYNCTSLNHVTIPASVTEIGDHAFDGCSGMGSLTMLSCQPPTIGGDTFCQRCSWGIMVPTECENNYKVAADQWRYYNGGKVGNIRYPDRINKGTIEPVSGGGS